MKIAVALAHGHTTKWLQVCIHSLKQFHNDVEFDIYVAATWPDHPSLKAITETSLGEGVTIIPCTIRLHSHATGLDQILDHISDMGYDFMFTTETDCAAKCDGWLDWFVSHMSNENIGMAGFFWQEGNNHYNINPSGTIYRMDMLEKYHQEVRENNENVFWHPRGNKHGDDAGMDPTIKDVAGIFSDTRGIKEPNQLQTDQIMKGVPQAAWFEPGAYLYYRSLGEYEHVAVECFHGNEVFGNHNAPEGTFYGGKENPKLIHFWGGTRAYDFLKHPVNDQFVKGCAPYWMAREDRIWKEIVPEEFRSKVYEIESEINLKGLASERLGVNLDDYYQ